MPDMNTKLDKRWGKSGSKLKNKTLKTVGNNGELTAKGGDRRSAAARPLHHFMLGFDFYQNECVAGLISDILAEKRGSC